MTLLPMENRESILCALKCNIALSHCYLHSTVGFEKDKSGNIPPILEDYIKQIARNGHTLKIHCEDPRLPSRAGLFDCDGVVGTSILSSPDSPNIDDLHRRQTSKSSDDDDEVTDEDENEEEEDGNHTETSSHASSSSPRDNAPSLTQPPILTNSPTCSAWPFGNGRASSPSKLHLSSPMEQSLPGDHPSTLDSGTEQSNNIGDTKQVDSRTERLLAVDSSGHQGLKQSGEKFGLSREEEGSGCRGRLADSIGTELDVEPVGLESPVVGNLRPIGQLEAFVQNVGVDSLCPSSLTNTPSEMTASSDEIDPVPEPVSPTNGMDETANSNEATVPALTTTDSNLTIGTKRRASSPPTNDPVNDDTMRNEHEAASNWDVVPSELEQSPAKRRRLADSVPKTPEHTDNSIASSTTVPIDLNDSPPIILSNPNGLLRDNHSPTNGSSSSDITPPPPTAIDADQAQESEEVGNGTVIPNPSGAVDVEIDEVTSSSSPPPPIADLFSARIDAETGEKESEKQMVQSDTMEGGEDNV